MYNPVLLGVALHDRLATCAGGRILHTLSTGQQQRRCWQLRQQWQPTAAAAAVAAAVGWRRKLALGAAGAPWLGSRLQLMAGCSA